MTILGRLPPRAATAAVLAVGLSLAGCNTARPVATPSASGAAADVKLAGLCPATVVVQLPWTPQAEHGAFYHLLGSAYTINAATKTVTGPLVAGGEDTGVDIELRAGGPAVGSPNAAVDMYADPRVMLGEVSTDDAIKLSATYPVQAVMAPLEKSPYMIQWDPKQYPDFHAIVDIGKRKTTVLYLKGAAYMDFLVGTGLLRPDQLDDSYDGSPARWLAEDGRIAQQGFATNEPYLYEKTLGQWKKPVEFQLLADAGYQVYPESVVVRTDSKAEYAACLKKLVPMIQRAQVEFVRDPAPTIDLIVKANDTYKASPYSREQARFSVDQQVNLGIVGNGDNATLGDFNDGRVWAVLDTVTPILAGQRKQIKAGLTAADLYTNEFIDRSVGLR